MNARNNVQGIGSVGRNEVFSAGDEKLFEVQRAVTRKLVQEAASFDNVYFEICNEPYERGGLTAMWNDAIVGAIREAEKDSPSRHLIAQGFSPSDKPIAGLNRQVSVLNFHAASPRAVSLNYPLNRVIAFDETGGSDTSDRKYRTEGWDFLMAGGGVYDHLGFSFTPDREDGTAFPLPRGTPGGGGPELRKQLAALKRFIEGFEFLRMRPFDECIESSRIRPEKPGDKARPATVRVLAEPGKAYAVYVNGGRRAEISIRLPAASYAAEWVDTKTGKTLRAEKFRHAGTKTLSSPDYSDDIALRLMATP
jgi:hypothetical protein